MELDASNVLTDIRQAQLSLSASALQLQQQESDKEKTILDAENAVRETERQFAEVQNELAVAQEKLPTDLASAERSVSEREAAVEQAEAALEQARATTLQDLGFTAQKILSGCEDLLGTLYGVLVNDTAARPLSGNKGMEVHYRLGNDASLRNQAESDYYAAREATDTMRGTYGNTLSLTRDTAILADALSRASAAASSIHTLADSTAQLLQGTVSDASVLTATKLSTLTQTASSARTSAASLMDEAETAQASLTGAGGKLTSITIKQKEDALETAENALLTAQENLRLLRTQTPGDLQKQEASLQKIQDDVKAKQAALDAASRNVNVSTKLKQNDIAQKSTSLAKTRKTLEDYRLTAPFEGVIRRLDYQVGDNLLDTGEEKYVILENPDFLIVTILLDQVDVVRVKKDMTARITFDALPEQEFQGAIDEIDPTPVEESGVVSYEVAIRLPKPADLTILSGMTATVEIETVRKESVLAVPNFALVHQNNIVFVQRADGSTAAVQTGVTDGRYTEILSGLTEGEQIVSLNISTTRSNTSANPAQLFRMGGGGEWGPPWR